MSETMRAAVCAGAGGPEVLEIRELPIPAVRAGWSLVLVKGAGLKGSAGAGVLRRIVGEVEAGVHRPHVDRVFALDDIAEAHRYMEGDQASGKLVVLP